MLKITLPFTHAKTKGQNNCTTQADQHLCVSLLRVPFIYFEAIYKTLIENLDLLTKDDKCAL